MRSEQIIVFVGARYKHVRGHEKYRSTYIPLGLMDSPQASWTALSQSKRRVLVILDTSYLKHVISGYATTGIEHQDC